MAECAISIHAPPRGATLICSFCSCVTIFQFTPLREGRRDIMNKLLEEISISIHAPPRGATRHTHLHFRIGYISIHAPPRGATTARGWEKKRWKFQFTPLREGRLFQVFCIPTEEIFQFTPLREGRRAAMADISAIGKISIHAPPRGATQLSATYRRTGALFQFTPLREGRPAR